MRTVFVIMVMLITASVSGREPALVELQRTALSGNPRLRAMEAQVLMMKKRIPQSTALEDPKVKLGINNLPVTSPSLTKDNMTSKEIGVSQKIPTGRLPFQKKIAINEYEMAQETLKAEKAETLHMLRLNYYELMYTLSSIRIVEDIQKQMKLVVDSEVAATKAGLGSLSNVVKAKIEYTMAEEELIGLRQRQEELEQNINYLAGTKVKSRITPLPDPRFSEIDAGKVIEELTASNPQLKILHLGVEMSRNEILLKKSEYAPDIDVGLSYMQRQDSRRKNFIDPMFGSGGASAVYKSEKTKRNDMVSAMVSISVPFWFWKKNIPMVEEMKKKSESARNLYLDALNRMTARANTLVSRMVKWRDLYRLYNDRLIPQAELALETTLARYRTSTVEFMPVVDTVRMLLRYRRERVMAVKEYYASYSELNALMGVEVLE
ncbi:MAG: TolC family protein [Spirochaetes bacterium]|nr:TolC family protein [Spirochaetota bacterium]